MRRDLIFSVPILLFLFIVILNNSAYSSPLESQIADTLANLPHQGEIHVGIIDFEITMTGGDQLSKDDIAKIKQQSCEEAEADLMKEIKKRGLFNKVSLIERKRINELLKEKILQTTGLTDQTAVSIGGIAGLDYIILGSLRVSDTEIRAFEKLIRVKDAKILDIAEATSKRDRLPSSENTVNNR